jgi:hypothetical protein
MSNNYQGKIGFTATITVKDHPEMDPQHIQSNLHDYQVAAPRTPTVAIGDVWGNGIIPFTSIAPSLPETGHALSAAFLSPDGKIKDLFQVVSAKFHLNNGKEYDVTAQITNDNSGTVTADPVRTDFLRSYDRSGYVNFTLILIDKLTKEQITIKSQNKAFQIVYPTLTPVALITSINNGLPVVPTFNGVTPSDVPITVAISGLGVDGLLANPSLELDLGGVKVNPLNFTHVYSNGGQNATVTFSIKHADLPLLLPGLRTVVDATVTPAEVYAAIAALSVDVIYEKVDVALGEVFVKANGNIRISDVIDVDLALPTNTNLDWTNQYDAVATPTQGTILIDKTPAAVDGIDLIPLNITGSFHDYQNVVDASVKINGIAKGEVKIMRDFSKGYARVARKDLVANYAASGDLAVSVKTKHLDNTEIVLGHSHHYVVNYPTLAALTTKVTSTNNGVPFWSDELWNNVEKTTLVTGTIDGFHALRSLNTPELYVDGTKRDVAITVGAVDTNGHATWSAQLPIKYLKLTGAGGSIELHLSGLYRPSGETIVATPTAMTYQTQSFQAPTLVVESVNGGDPIGTGLVEIVVGLTLNAAAIDLDATANVNLGDLTINGSVVSVAWGTKVVDGKIKQTTTLPASNFKPIATGAGAGQVVVHGVTSRTNGPTVVLDSAAVSYTLAPENLADYTATVRNLTEAEVMQVLYPATGEVIGDWILPFNAPKTTTWPMRLEDTSLLPAPIVMTGEAGTASRISYSDTLPTTPEPTQLPGNVFNPLHVVGLELSSYIRDRLQTIALTTPDQAVVRVTERYPNNPDWRDRVSTFSAGELSDSELNVVKLSLWSYYRSSSQTPRPDVAYTQTYEVSFDNFATVVATYPLEIAPQYQSDLPDPSIINTSPTGTDAVNGLINVSNLFPETFTGVVMLGLLAPDGVNATTFDDLESALNSYHGFAKNYYNVTGGVISDPRYPNMTDWSIKVSNFSAKLNAHNSLRLQADQGSRDDILLYIACFSATNIDNLVLADMPVSTAPGAALITFDEVANNRDDINFHAKVFVARIKTMPVVTISCDGATNDVTLDLSITYAGESGGAIWIDDADSGSQLFDVQGYYIQSTDPNGMASLINHDQTYFEVVAITPCVVTENSNSTRTATQTVKLRNLESYRPLRLRMGISSTQTPNGDLMGATIVQSPASAVINPTFTIVSDTEINVCLSPAPNVISCDGAVNATQYLNLDGQVIVKLDGVAMNEGMALDQNGLLQLLSSNSNLGVIAEEEVVASPPPGI